MELIQKLLNTEEVNYASSLNGARLKKKILELFEQKSLRVSGKLTSENEFTAYDKLAVIGWDMPNLRRKSAYLKGIITQSENGSVIKLKVHPNAMLPFFAVLAALIGVSLTFIALSNTDTNKLLLILGIVSMALGLIYYPVSTWFRNRLRNKIVKYLDLNKIPV